MKGFFGFVVVTAMLLLLLGLAITENTFYSKFGSAKTFLVDAEQASKERTVMENNFDKIVRTKLIEQILQENFEIEFVKNEINSTIFDYLENKTFASTIFSENLGPLSLDFLNNNSEAIVLEKKGITYAEYSFTGGLFNDKTASSEFGEDLSIRFMVPPKYIMRVIG